VESDNYQELKNYLAIVQTDDICMLALAYATFKEWDLLALVTEELEKRNFEDKKQTKKTVSEIQEK